MLYFRPKYALNHTLGCESDRVFFGGGALRTMVKDILVAIDAEIARLEQAKALLSTSGAFVAKRKPGRPAKVASIEAPKVQKARKRSKIERRGAGAHPAGADQAAGCLEERIQSEHE